MYIGGREGWRKGGEMDEEKEGGRGGEKEKEVLHVSVENQKNSGGALVQCT